MNLPFGWLIDIGAERRSYARALLGSVVLPLALCGLALLWALVFPRSQTVVISLGISAILVVGYQIFVGSTGIVSFGHMAFAAVGGYTAAILTTPVAIKSISLPDIPFGLGGFSTSLVFGALMGGLVAGLVALVSGLGLMRLTGAAAGVCTLALLLIVNEILRNADSFTRGTQTFYGVPDDLTIAGLYLTLAAASLVAVAFKFSRAGLKARAGRDAALAAETAGVPILRSRLVAWTLSAFVTGIGGALYVHQLTAFSPATFGIGLTIPIVVMSVVGGMSSVAGAVVGAALLTVWLEVMRGIEGGSLLWLSIPQVSGLSQLTVGVGLLLLLRVRPRGVLDNRELRTRSIRRHAKGQPDRAAVGPFSKGAVGGGRK